MPPLRTRLRRTWPPKTRTRRPRPTAHRVTSPTPGWTRTSRPERAAARRTARSPTIYRARASMPTGPPRRSRRAPPRTRQVSCSGATEPSSCGGCNCPRGDDRHHRHGQLGVPGRHEGLEAVHGRQSDHRDAPHLEDVVVGMDLSRLPVVGGRILGAALRRRRDQRQRHHLRGPVHLRVPAVPRRPRGRRSRNRPARRGPGRRAGRHASRRSPATDASRRPLRRRRSPFRRTRRGRRPPPSAGCTSIAGRRATTRAVARPRRSST